MTYGNKTQGMTLLEVNLALGILVFGVVSVASLFPVGMKVSNDAAQATDASLIASMAKAEIELLQSSGVFEYPEWQLWGGVKRDAQREGAAVATDAARNKPTGKIMKCKGLRDRTLNWDAGCWAGGYLLMTSGGAAGKVFPISKNTLDAVELEIKYDLKDSGIHGGDSFRVIFNRCTLKCIPADFLSSGATIPTVNGLSLETVRETRNNPAFGLADIRDMNMQTLDLAKFTKYTYAVMLDNAELASPNLYRAYVLVYRNYGTRSDGITPVSPWEAEAIPPKEFYLFFYRKPALAQTSTGGF